MAGLTASAKALFEEEIGYGLSRSDDRRAFEDWLTSEEFVPDRHQPPDQIYMPTPWLTLDFPVGGPTGFDWDRFFDQVVEATREEKSPAPAPAPAYAPAAPSEKRRKLVAGHARQQAQIKVRQRWEEIIARFPFDRLEPIEFADASGELVGPCFIMPLDRPVASIIARANRELAPRRFTHRRVRQVVGEVRYDGYGVWRLK